MLHLGLLLFGLAAPAFATSFSDVFPGAKPMGMGMAYTAVADDMSAMWFNPGGLAGSDFTQMSLSAGRMFSPRGPLAFYAANYARPFPLRQDSVIGAGYFLLREANGGDRDQFVLHYSEPVKLPQLYLTRPLKAGANFKILQIDGGTKGKKSAVAVDAGVVAETNFGLKGGMALIDLMPDAGIPAPTIALGLAYAFKDRITLAGDIRARKGDTEFYPGMEFSFYQGLLKARIGKGMPLGGIGQVALGAGVNFSPVIFDFAMSIPWAGSTRNGGAYQMTMSYRFDAPPFYGRFVGSAARQAEDLKSELLELEDKKRTLDTQVTAAETTKQSVEGQLRSMESRARSLQEQLRSLEIKVDEKRYEVDSPKKAAPPPAPVPAPKAAVIPKAAPAPWPHKHTVAAGDTLRSIAAQHYGDPSLWELIYNANPEKIDRGLPREGELLVIPAPGGSR